MSLPFKSLSRLSSLSLEPPRSQSLTSRSLSRLPLLPPLEAIDRRLQHDLSMLSHNLNEPPVELEPVTAPDTSLWDYFQSRSIEASHRVERLKVNLSEELYAGIKKQVEQTLQNHRESVSQITANIQQQYKSLHTISQPTHNDHEVKDKAVLSKTQQKKKKQELGVESAANQEKMAKTKQIRAEIEDL